MIGGLQQNSEAGGQFASRNSASAWYREDRLPQAIIVQKPPGGDHDSTFVFDCDESTAAACTYEYRLISLEIDFIADQCAKPFWEGDGGFKSTTSRYYFYDDETERLIWMGREADGSVDKDAEIVAKDMGKSVRNLIQNKGMTEETAAASRGRFTMGTMRD